MVRKSCFSQRNGPLPTWLQTKMRTAQRRTDIDGRSTTWPAVRYLGDLTHEFLRSKSATALAVGLATRSLKPAVRRVPGRG